MRETIEVSVTEDHIKNGKRGQCAMCPIALAIRDVCPNKMISVGITNARVGHFAYDLPDKAIDFIRYFDFSLSSGVVLKPIRFILSEGKPSTYWL